MVSAADIAPYVSLAFLFVVGLGLGASTTIDDFKAASRKPKAVGIGFLSQYLFMPVASYLLALAFGVDDRIAIGAVLIGCSPGGSTSNLFTYWSRGDVALSITMSFLSTVAAFLLMPFWIWVLVKQALGSSAQVAWANMIMSLMLILLPTMAGLLTRKYNTQTKLGGKFIWKWVELLASILGVLFLIASVAVAILSYGSFFSETPWQVWVMGAIMQPLGCAFGYYVSMVLGMPIRDMRTISLETGIQSFSLTIAVIQLSFEDDYLRYALMFPVAYGFLYLFWSPIIVLLFRHYNNLATTEDAESPEKEIEEGDLEAGKEEVQPEEVEDTTEEVGSDKEDKLLKQEGDFNGAEDTA